MLQFVDVNNVIKVKQGRDWGLRERKKDRQTESL